MAGLAWTPNVVQLETQDADAGQLVSFGLDRPNQRGAAAEADVNAHTHLDVMAAASLLLYRTGQLGRPGTLLEEIFCFTTQHSTICQVCC